MFVIGFRFSVLKPRYVRVNTNLLSMADVFEMLAAEEWRKKYMANTGSYNDFLEAITKLEEDEYMLDIHLEDLLIFHSKQKHYWACHPYVKDKKLMLQDKVSEWCKNNRFKEKHLVMFRVPVL